MAPSSLDPEGFGLLSPRAVPHSGPVNLGTGSIPGKNLNNAGFLALFAVLGGAMVLAAIYFFFLAKNGGFRRITKNDWDDYKSTVLRRKGPDGKTLSNATKSTRLGGGSVVPKWAQTEYDAGSYRDSGEMAERGEARPAFAQGRREVTRNDPELKAYKHEKAAKVGGINTSMHGSQWDHSNTERSAASEASTAKKSGKTAAKTEKKRDKKIKKKAGKGEKGAAAGSDTTATTAVDSAPTHSSTAPPAPGPAAQAKPSIRQVSTASASYYSAYRPSHTRSSSPPQVAPPPPQHRTPSPRKPSRPRPSTNGYSAAPSTPPSASAASEGTKVYSHYIPGLSEREVGVEDSVSQAGARRAREGRRTTGGYRRARGDEF